MLALNSKIYENLTELTSQIDAENLYRVFASIVTSLYPNADIRLYTNRLPAGTEYFDLNFIQQRNNIKSIMQIQQQDMELLHKIFHDDESIKLDDAIVVYPLIIRQLNFGALIVEAELIEEVEKQQSLLTYLSIFTNQLNLLRTRAC